ncbi:MAG: response regulator [Deltaproteobacteria bacterium]|nr:response regulator [Deltaproteobacteria bacterium]
MRVLIVEEDVDLACTVADKVSSWNHPARTVHSCRDALRSMAVAPFDLVLIDVFLPDALSHEIIPRIRKIRADIPIVTITGYNTRELERAVRLQGVLYYMIKPFEEEALKSILDHLEEKNRNEETCESRKAERGKRHG